ncbi:MAG: PD40 domain-containing protein [Gemmatimonadaceae bacterium]|nr:PD40 domain-containing protein [Gemmatimonadaceae bacterium]
MKSLRTSVLGVGAAISALSLRPQAYAEQPVGVPTVVVVATEPNASFIRSILYRDFDYGDRLRLIDADPVAVAAGFLPGGVPNYAVFDKMKVRALVIPAVEPTGVRISYHDVRFGRMLQQAFFPLPKVPALRPAEIRDSVMRAYATKDSLTDIALRRVSFVWDSLRTVARGKRDKDKKKQLIAQAKRDSLAAVTIAEGIQIRKDAQADIAERDSAIPILVYRDSVARDSLAYEHRMAIHGVSDEVTRWITGQRGFAQSRLVYVHNGTLRVVDSDGANDRAITNGGSALSPSWHPAGNRIVYSDFNDAGTQIAQVDIWTRRVKLVEATRRGLNVTPAYTPDGRRIVYTAGGVGPSDLVVTYADSLIPARRFSYAAQETSSPSFSPDGSRVAYISPRIWQGSGTNARLTPQIFTMNADGTGEVQLTPTSPGVRSYRTSPDWSPDGTRVAYMQQQGDFQLWTIGVRDRKMNKLTSVGENEDPTWAPDSRHLAFTSNRSGTKEIWVLDTQTGRYRQLTYRGGGARLAAWSRLLGSWSWSHASISTPAPRAGQQH